MKTNHNIEFDEAQCYQKPFIEDVYEWSLKLS